MPATQAHTIVLADDASEVRLLLRTRLRLAGGFDVVGEAADGVEAVALAARHHPALMLLDVSMPRLDGLEALPQVLEASPETRVVLFSGFDEQGLAEKARELGAAAFVEKSASMEELIGRLQEVTRASAPAAGRGEPAADVLPYTQRGTLSVDQHVLDEHLERFREVFEQAAIGMATMTLTGTLVRVNGALARLLGRPVDELVGRFYGDVTDDQGRRLSSALAEVRSRPVDVVRLEHRLGGTDGTVLLATIAPVRDSLGRPLYAFVQVQDVTAERAAVEALRRSEERFRLLVEAVEDYAIFMLDPRGHVVSWNAGAERIKQYTAEEVVGRHFSVFYPEGEVARKHPEHELEVALREGRYAEEGWRLRKDGTRFWANVLITAIHDSEGRHVGFAKITRDTTERRRLEEERERALEALATANTELETLNGRLREAADEQAQFLAMTAHELRTPVGVLGGSAEMLTRHWAELEGEERTELLDAMASSTVRLKLLLDDLLTASRLQAGALSLRLEEVELADAVTAAAGTVRRTHPGADVHAEVPPGVRVVGDRERLTQVVENLLVNAVRHGVPPVRLSARVVGGSAEVRVRDGGPGVPDEIMPRLFGRFATGAGRKGTGLGLSIVRELARAHGGDVRYDPGRDGEGWAFVVTLPLAGHGPADTPADGRVTSPKNEASAG